MGSGAWGYALERLGMGLALDALGLIGRVEALRPMGCPRRRGSCVGGRVRPGRGRAPAGG